MPPRDEVKRLDTWMITVFGADDNDYTRAVSRLSLIAAVCRVRFPGCKFDTAPVLIGSQGVAKSTALRVLAVKDEWFTDQPILAQRSQTQMELMEGGWIYEIADLDGMRRAETTYVKAFMSRQFDKSRMAYRHLTEERGRQCVFFATTNDSKFLKDETGNRRSVPDVASRHRGLKFGAFSKPRAAPIQVSVTAPARAFVSYPGSFTT